MPSNNLSYIIFLKNSISSTNQKEISIKRKMKNTHSFFINFIISFTTILFTLFCTPSMAQNDSITQDDVITFEEIEFYRNLGYLHRENPDSSMKYYKMILQLDSTDWDANLAVARLYFNEENYEKSIFHYNQIYTTDTNDVEALWGFGRCYFRMGQFEEALQWYLRANQLLENHIPLLIDIAHAHTNNNMLKESINSYQNILILDSTHAYSWAGMGKMYYWLGKPLRAKKHYQKAIQLEPNNEEYIEMLQRISKELGYQLIFQSMFINESEPINAGSDMKAYNINAFVNRISIQKRVHDNIFLSIGTLIDRSHREYAWSDTEKRWYDHTHIRSMFIFGSTKLSLYGSISKAENLLSSYGFSMHNTKKIKHFQLSNTLQGGYDYYYYWNEVGHDYITDHAKIQFKNFTLEGVVRYANVREMYLLDIDTIGRNKNLLYTISANYKFFSNPMFTVGIFHQYRDYAHRSPLYWSPQDRKLNGINASATWKYKDKLYTSIYGNTGKDNYDITHWEASFELGYIMKNSSISIGAYRFYNPWYESFNTQLSITKNINNK
jgi:tetratricopeptide (TPR) repeat protein